MSLLLILEDTYPYTFSYGIEIQNLSIRYNMIQHQILSVPNSNGIPLDMLNLSHSPKVFLPIQKFLIVPNFIYLSSQYHLNPSPNPSFCISSHQIEDYEYPVLSIRILDQFFAVDEEPVGVRVVPQHKPYAIRQILNALDAEEVDTIRSSPFGELVEIGEKPSFS